HPGEDEQVEQEVVAEVAGAHTQRGVGGHEGVAGDHLGPPHPLGPGERDPAAVADQVDQAQVDPGQAPDQEGVGGVLAGVDHQLPAADLAGGPVQPAQQVQVAPQPGPGGAG